MAFSYNPKTGKLKDSETGQTTKVRKGESLNQAMDRVSGQEGRYSNVNNQDRVNEAKVRKSQAEQEYINKALDAGYSLEDANRSLETGQELLPSQSSQAQDFAKKAKSAGYTNAEIYDAFTTGKLPTKEQEQPNITPFGVDASTYRSRNVTPSNRFNVDQTKYQSENFTKGQPEDPKAYLDKGYSSEPSDIPLYIQKRAQGILTREQRLAQANQEAEQNSPWLQKAKQSYENGSFVDKFVATGARVAYGLFTPQGITLTGGSLANALDKAIFFGETGVASIISKDVAREQFAQMKESEKAFVDAINPTTPEGAFNVASAAVSVGAGAALSSTGSATVSQSVRKAEGELLGASKRAQVKDAAKRVKTLTQRSKESRGLAYNPNKTYADGRLIERAKGQVRETYTALQKAQGETTISQVSTVRTVPPRSDIGSFRQTTRTTAKSKLGSPQTSITQTQSIDFVPKGNPSTPKAPTPSQRSGQDVYVLDRNKGASAQYLQQEQTIIRRQAEKRIPRYAEQPSSQRPTTLTTIKAAEKPFETILESPSQTVPRNPRQRIVNRYLDRIRKQQAERNVKTFFDEVDKTQAAPQTFQASKPQTSFSDTTYRPQGTISTIESLNPVAAATVSTTLEQVGASSVSRSVLTSLAARRSQSVLVTLNRQQEQQTAQRSQVITSPKYKVLQNNALASREQITTATTQNIMSSFTSRGGSNYVNNVVQTPPSFTIRTPQPRIPTSRPSVIRNSRTQNLQQFDDTTPTSPLILLRPRKKKSKEDAYAAFVRRGGKFRRVSAAVSFGDAVALGAYKVAQSAAATFKVEPVQGAVTESSAPSVDMSQFRRKGNVFIQKLGKRIQSQAEKEQITYKGIEASRRKRKTILG